MVDAGGRGAIVRGGSSAREGQGPRLRRLMQQVRLLATRGIELPGMADFDAAYLRTGVDPMLS